MTPSQTPLIGGDNEASREEREQAERCAMLRGIVKADVRGALLILELAQKSFAELIAAALGDARTSLKGATAYMDAAARGEL